MRKMHGTTTKYCIYCGKKIPIDTKKCPYCLKWQEDEDDVSRNHFINSYVSPEHEMELKEKSKNKKEETRKESIQDNTQYNLNEEYSDILPIRRQLLLLLVGGWFYSVWWYYKSNTLLKDRFNKDIRPGWRTVGFIIPIVNWFMYYILLRDYEKLIRNENIESYDSILNTLIFIFIPIIGDVWTFCNVQESMNQLWQVKERNLPIRRSFTNGEIIFLVVIMVLILLLIMTFLSVIFYSLQFLAM